MWGRRKSRSMCHAPINRPSNAGEEAGRVLVDENEVSVNQGCSQDWQEGAYISRSKVVWAGHWDELEDHSRKDVKHRPKRGIHEGYDGAATLECFLFFGQGVSRRKLTSFTSGPRVRLAILLGQLWNECVDNCGRFLIDGFKDWRVNEGIFNRLIIKARTVDSEWRGFFVFTVKDGAFQQVLEGGDGWFCDVTCDLLSVLLP